MSEAPYVAGFVALVGRPNVGKSTLLNALLGSKIAIVTPKPQTTRTAIRGILHREDGQIVFVDTPGIHRPEHRLGQHMLQTAWSQLKDIDLLWHVVDLSRRPGDEDERVWAGLKRVSAPIWLVANKVDRVPDAEAALAQYLPHADYARHFLISAREGTGLEALEAATWSAMPEGVPYYPDDMVTDQNEDQYVAEIIREKVLETTREEVPHSVAVTVEERERRQEDLMYVRAAIYVERDGQKAILIGRGGGMLKQIGEAARRDLEEYYGHRVFLDLWVKVRKGWRDEEGWLRRLGYTSPTSPRP